MGRRGSVAVAVVVAIVVVAVLLTRSGPKRVLYATFQSATNLVDGNYVTVGGVNVGSVSSIAVNGQTARVALSIGNARLWPLHQGTTAEIRFGGTVSYSDRYVELMPGPISAPALRSGARLPLTDTVTPVEFDQLFDVFNAPARRSLGALTDNAASTFGPRAHALTAGIAALSPALSVTSQDFADLDASQGALGTLIASATNIAHALRDTQPQLLDLVGGASTTLGALATHAAATESTLSRLPGTLDAARHTLTTLNPTLSRLRTLATALRPGAGALRALAAPVSDAVGRLGSVAPQLDETLATIQSSAPSVTRLLSDTRPLAQGLAPALEQLGPIVGCLRPYTPELAGFIATWDSLGIFHDAQSVTGRVEAQEFPFPDTSPFDSATLVKTFPGLLYSLIRPPGYNAGQPWYQPQCGAGPSGLDAGADPEAPSR